MGRSAKDYAILIGKGMAMGAADVVPGVSGGTIAFISGIYKELVETISGLNFGLIGVWKKEGFNSFLEKSNLSFLIALVSGILISVFTIMRLVSYFLEHHPVLLWAFFFGLVLASVLYIGKQIEDWSFTIILALIISAIIAFGLTRLSVASNSDHLLFLFISGAIASCAMILPGISGAFILVLLGAYAAVTEAVHNFDIKKIMVIGLGVISGLLSFSHLLKWLFNKYQNITLAILTGFVLGSLNKIWPWKKVLKSIEINEKIIPVKEASVLPTNYQGEPQILLVIVLAILGFATILLLERLAQKKN